LFPMITLNPLQIQQAADARFYENFVFNTIQQIPSNCLVFTYDPSLFTINGRAAVQLGYRYDARQYKQLSSNYTCMVLDYGYWCHTPDNFCSDIGKNFTKTQIATTTYEPLNENYGFYYLHVR